VSARELHRYEGLLLAKRCELSIARADVLAPVPAAGGWCGNLIDQAIADAQTSDAQTLIMRAQSNRLIRPEGAGGQQSI
jgi:hypothetical protein